MFLLFCRLIYRRESRKLAGISTYGKSPKRIILNSTWKEMRQWNEFQVYIVWSENMILASSDTLRLDYFMYYWYCSYWVVTIMRDFKPEEGFSLFMLRSSHVGWAEGKSKNWEDQNMKSGKADPILKSRNKTSCHGT